MTDIQKTLKERGAVHGDFSDNAVIAQQLKTIVRSNNRDHLSPIMLEALEMITHKIARILSGNAAHKDHWHDIAGYATLVEERLL